MGHLVTWECILLLQFYGSKQHAIFYVKCTWRILPCPVVRSDVYSKMWSCFGFRIGEEALCVLTTKWSVIFRSDEELTLETSAL